LKKYMFTIDMMDIYRALGFAPSAL